jgi:hypothetical protein
VWAALALGGGLSLGFAAPAAGATQIGETFPVTGGCSAGFTWFASASPNGTHRAPFDGVITSWSFHAGATAPQLKFKVGRPVAPTRYTIVGDTDMRSTAPNILNTFPAQIPVLAGDVIGFFTVTGSHPCLRPNTGHNYAFSSGDVPPGATATFGGEIHQQLDIAALLEADADNDGFGDETQDRCPTEPSQTGGPCSRAITLDPSKSKVRKGKRVLFSGQLHAPNNEADCESNQTVQLERKRPGETAFAPLGQLQADSAGAFSTKVRVRKTYEYRAEVTESAGCRSAVSEAQKVKAKKKKKKKKR